MKNISVLAALSLLLLSPALPADEHEPAPALSDVWWVVPKNGMENQFEEAVKLHMQFRAEQGESRAWWTFTPTIGDRMNVYVFRSCCFNWADIDSFLTEDQEKGFGENWNANVHQYVDHYHHYMERTDWEHSYWPDEGTDGPYYGVTEWTWKEDAGPASSAARKELSKMALEADWGTTNGPWVWMSRIGGKDKLMIVSPYSDYAAMAPPEKTFYDMVTEKVGEKKRDALFADFNSGFVSSEYSVWRYAEDLSSPSDEEE